MSFSIVFMNNQQELNKISKSPSTVMTLTGTLREETDIVDPQIVEETPEEEQNPLDVANDIFSKICGRRANNG